MTAATDNASTLAARIAAAVDDGIAPNVARWARFTGARKDIDWLELQVLDVPTGRGSFIESRYAHASTAMDVGRLATEGEKFGARGIYYILNRVHPAITSQSKRGVWHVAKKGEATSDADIEHRWMLYVDVDAERPKASKIAATEIERAIAFDVAQSIYDRLCLVFGENAVGFGDSGNGFAPMLALERVAANDAGVTALIRALLVALDLRFRKPGAHVDRATYDPKRLGPAWGTWKRKGGDEDPERPHRRTGFLCADVVTRVSVEDLRRLFGELRIELSPEDQREADAALAGKPVAKATQPTPSTTQAPDNPFARAKALSTLDVASFLGLVDGDSVRCPGCGETKGTTVYGTGFKCSHNRCADKGVDKGFRTNVDLVMEVRSCTAVEAVNELAERFGFEGVRAKRVQTAADRDAGRHPYERDAEPVDPLDPEDDGRGPERAPAGAPRPALALLGPMLRPALERAKRRATGIEKPVPMPLRSIEPHFAGGLWPGLHVLIAAPGAGKTQLALQQGKRAAEAGIPVAYIGLELEENEIAMRMMGVSSHVPWSYLWTGKAGPAYIDRAEASIEKLSALPIHPEFGGPHGWSVNRLTEIADALRAQYPEEDGPGSRPCLIIVDFMQLVGPPEDDKKLDIRERVGRAAYACREIGRTRGMAVLAISSVGRASYAIGDLAGKALGYEVDDDGQPIKRQVLAPETLMGIAKESGDVEFSADTVSVIFAVSGTKKETGVDVVFATAKGRAMATMWSPLHFTGFEYQECADGGARVVEVWKNATEKRDAAKSARDAAKAESQRARQEESDAKKRRQEQEREATRLARAIDDAASVAAYVIANPKCSVRDARVKAVSNNSERWARARMKLGAALDTGDGLQLLRDRLDPAVEAELTSWGIT